MSYNIDSIEVKKISAKMRAADICKLNRDLRGKLPESCFLEDLNERAIDILSAGDADAEIPLERFDWQGEGSGHALANLPLIAAKIIGEVEAVVCWEGGDSLTGLIIKDGKYIECDVETTLVPKME